VVTAAALVVGFVDGTEVTVRTRPTVTSVPSTKPTTIAATVTRPTITSVPSTNPTTNAATVTRPSKMVSSLW
jgi:hypothetical protein